MKKLNELRNIDIRKVAKSKNVMLYEIAEHLKISDPTMTRKMRHELPQDEKERIFKIIDDIAARRAVAVAAAV